MNNRIKIISRIIRDDAGKLLSFISLIPLDKELVDFIISKSDIENLTFFLYHPKFYSQINDEIFSKHYEKFLEALKCYLMAGSYSDIEEYLNEFPEADTLFFKTLVKNSLSLNSINVIMNDKRGEDDFVKSQHDLNPKSSSADDDLPF